MGAALNLPRDIDYTILSGRVDRVPVTPDQLGEAIILAFNLRRERGLGASADREKAAMKALGLNISIRAYHDRDRGPQQELMTLLAKRLLVIGDGIVGVKTESVELTFHLEPQPAAEGFEITTRLARLDAARVLRATADDTTKLVVPMEVVGFGRPGDEFRPISTGCQTEGVCDSDGFMNLQVSFPRIDYGELCEVKYSHIPHGYPFNPNSEYYVQPVKSYGRVIIHLRIVGERQPRAVLSFSDRRILRMSTWSSLDRVQAAPDGTYSFTVERPKARLCLGFVTMFRRNPDWLYG